MKVNLSVFRGARNPRVMDARITEVIEKSEQNNDPVYISDILLAEKSGEYLGSLLLEELRKDEEKKYKLRCLGGQFREKQYPGDYVIRRTNKTLKVQGAPIPGRELNLAVKTGQWDKKFVRSQKFKIDEKGCISCSADDAWYFLTHFGIEHYNRTVISFYPNEFSEDPKKNHSNGKNQIVQYYRFEELEAAEYERAPLIEKRPNNEKTQSRK